MKFISTRGGECVTGAQAIAQGIAKDRRAVRARNLPFRLRKGDGGDARHELRGARRLRAP